MRRSAVRLLIGWSVCLAALLASSSAAFAIDEFPAPGNPSGITAGPDGAIWFTEESGNKIGRMTTGGAITNEIPIPTGPVSTPSEITVGPDGLLWFTEFDGNKIGRVNADLSISEFSTSGNPDGIVAGPDGALWFTRFGSDQVSRITTAGAITNTYSVGNEPGDITVGPGSDGRLWFTEGAANRIGVIATDGSGFTDFPIPTAGGDPSGITASGGALWFTESGAGQIGRISTTGQVNEFGPTATDPSSIALGPDGALWFTASLGNVVGRITTTGAITNQFPLAASSEPSSITAGPDSALWFTEKTGNKIGRIAVAPPFVAPPPPPPPPPSVSAAKKCKVPKLKGLTKKKARSRLKKAGCKYRIRGKGRVRSTVPKAGARTTKTVIVKLAKKRRKAKRSVHSASVFAATLGVHAFGHQHDLADRPEADGLRHRHASKKPRRNNRRLRAPGGREAYSGLARDGTRAADAANATSDTGRRKSKRSLMRRLMTVRGGLQA